MFRKILCAATLIAASAVVVPSVYAQAAAPAQTAGSDSTATTKPHHMHVMRKLMKGVNLTSDQKGQMHAIFAKYAPQIKEAHQANDHATVKQLRLAMIGDARGVLTADQQKQFDANRAQLKQQRAAKKQNQNQSQSQNQSQNQTPSQS